MERVRWTEEETRQALFLYFQMPFGRLHQHAPEIIALAARLGRTPSSIAMKLSNFASLDPQIVESGRSGLQDASRLDRDVFARFYGRWDALVEAVGDLTAELLAAPEPPSPSRLSDVASAFRSFEGPSEVERTAMARRGQGFFRQAVLANFEEQCCVTGIADARLLIASHIKPWQDDIANRHNPSNGFALSATFDRAFDRGLVTIERDLTVRVSSQLLSHTSERTRTYFAAYNKRPIHRPTRFMPDAEMLAWHNGYFESVQSAPVRSEVDL